MNNHFKHKVVVITGAGSGMGRAYALAFAQRGAQLALNDFNAQGLDETVALVKQRFAATQVLAQAFDVSDRDAMFAFADQVKSQLGQAYVVINNAGVEGAFAPTWQMDFARMQRTMNINFYGVVHGTHAFLPHLIAQKSGHLVNVSSIFGLIGTPNHSDYCASKFAVRGFTEALMTELQHSKIKVHLLHPGGIATNIAQSKQGQAFSQHYLTTSPDDIAEHLIKHLGRGTSRIVYGQDAFKTWLGATVLPLGLLNKVIWQDMKKVLDLNPYRQIK
jgi:NAD(P)-dependent dehydrogenase (short-subunit alcohol dehydrogenase family)